MKAKSILQTFIIALFVGNTDAVRLYQNDQRTISDALKDLSAKIPETKIMENKLTKMMKLSPDINGALDKVNVITAIPEQSKINKQEKAAGKVVEAFDNAAKKIEEITDKKGKAVSKKEVSSLIGQSVRTVPTCNANQDEDLDDCTGTFVEKQTEEDADDDKIQKLDKESDQTSFGDAAMDMMAHVSKKLNFSDDQESESKDEKKKDEKAISKALDKADKEASKEDEAAEESDSEESDKKKIKKSKKKAEKAVEEGDTETAKKEIKKTQKLEKKKEDKEELKELVKEERTKAKVEKEEKEDDEAKDDGSAVDKNKLQDLAKDIVKKEAKKNVSVKDKVAKITEGLEKKGKKKTAADKADKMKKELDKEDDASEKQDTVSEIQKMAASEIKKTQDSANNAIRELVIQQETEKGGVINMITNALSKSATIQKEKDDNRSRIETNVNSRTTASSSRINSTRDALTGGLESTKDQTPELTQSKLEAEHIDQQEARPITDALKAPKEGGVAKSPKEKEAEKNDIRLK